MATVLDLHIHSKYSRACSPALNLENIAKVSEQKGVDIIATGDFTYPAWFKSLQEELVEEKGSGLYYLKKQVEIKTRFILATELSLVYKDEKQVRRLHMMVQAPNLEAVKELNNYLDKHYNIRSDGRPILKLKAPELVEICLKIHPQFLIYPAHIWTPWYAIFGSKSGFDSLEECFKEQTEHIYAYETGLSSDPEMNWRLSALDNLTTLSSSDAHSLQNIGREANVFNLEVKTYSEIYRAIKEKDLKVLDYTIEFYPEEGMYYLDGHRDCNYSSTPVESLKNQGMCPVCKKPLVLGVFHRVEQLADRSLGYLPKNRQGFKKLIELDKIIAESLAIKNRQAKKVQAIYLQMIKSFGSELKILLEVDILEIEKEFGSLIALGIKRVRNGDLKIEPGFDGQYGKINIFSNKEINKQVKLL
ncbi:MAG: endonuclease Q family protein [Candidatus Pacebacteria bacterium]|nr:endonuclease Q family protein [Candidatus Paceibacterota bacterium]